MPRVRSAQEDASTFPRATVPRHVKTSVLIEQSREIARHAALNLFASNDRDRLDRIVRSLRSARCGYRDDGGDVLLRPDRKTR